MLRKKVTPSLPHPPLYLFISAGQNCFVLRSKRRSWGYLVLAPCAANAIPPRPPTADIRRPITSHEIPLIVRAVLPIHEKFDLDLRCVADTRNVAAYLVLSSLLYSAAGSTGALLAAILLALAVHFQVQLEAGAAKAGEWFHM